MLSPLRAFADPLLHELLLRFGELAIALRRGHDLVGIMRKEALHQLTFIGFAGHDGAAALCGLFVIEPEITFPLRGIGAVAVVTVLTEDWLDVATEVDGSHTRRGEK